MRPFQILVWWILVPVLWGCTDHETISQPSHDGKLMTGVFRDSEVTGLTYETETQLGKTDVAGEFLFKEGENISFFVGGIYLGSGTAATVMSPVSIASQQPSSLSSQEVKNLASFLQSLDHDSEPGNGIIIKKEVAEALKNKQIDFTNMKLQDLGEVLAGVIQQTDANLKPVYPEKAAVHLNQTFGEVYVPQDHASAYFIPAIEGWHELSFDAVHWIHYTDENNRLLTSSLYDKRPFRVVMQNEYTAFNAAGLPVEFRQKTLANDQFSEEKLFRITYTAKNQLESITTTSTEGEFLSKVKITNMDGHFRINEALHYNENGEFLLREKVIYDKSGVRSNKEYYSTSEGTSKESKDFMGNTSYAYNEHGEYRVVTHYSTDEILTDVYRYRADKTLRKTEHYRYSDQKWKRIVEYDSRENIISVTTVSGDNSNKSFTASKEAPDLSSSH
ncbi:hypothetical protein V6B16_10635 [Salinimicrobium catena]|uniref:hypothetical protein n=1 Tax=Salinimicrobium catena TaxID=390640 RepID=UPI002FE4BC87